MAVYPDVILFFSAKANQGHIAHRFVPGLFVFQLAEIKPGQFSPKFHLGWTPYVIEEAEVYPLNFTVASQGPALEPVVLELTPVPQISLISTPIYSGLLPRKKY